MRLNPVFFLWAAAASIDTLSVRASSLSSTTTSNSATVVSHGLQNLGNTCYLNSQLQCAFHIPRVRSLIENPPAPPVVVVEDEEKDDDEEDGNASVVEFTDSDVDADGVEKKEDDAQLEAEEKEQVPEKLQPVSEPESIATQALRRVFRDMKLTSDAVAPRILCQALGIPVFEQQDSQEFWKLLLPALKVPVLVDLYQGCFEDFITANDGSNRERRREEPFLDLSLDVSRSSALEGLRESFGSAELLSVDEGNGWRPEKGADKVDALKGCLLRVQGLPSILQLHLKRFNYDWQTDIMSKINNRFSFPEELDLSSVCADIQDSEISRACYKLQSVVIHVGEFGSGHYYAYVRPDVLSDNWYRFNDHVATKVSFDEVVADAYGGRNAQIESESSSSNDNRKKSKGPGGFLRRLGSIFKSKDDPFGYGGRTSNAYVVQYVRKTDIPSLYLFDEE